MVHVAGWDVSGLRPFRVSRAGIGYVPQGWRVFPSLMVHEHLAMVARHKGAGTLGRVYKAFLRLAERRSNGGAALLGSEQQTLAVARALLLNPALLIMDEPSEGLGPVFVERLMALLRCLPGEGKGLLLVEQKIAVSANVVQQALIMVGGSPLLPRRPRWRPTWRRSGSTWALARR